MMPNFIIASLLLLGVTAIDPLSVAVDASGSASVVRKERSSAFEPDVSADIGKRATNWTLHAPEASREAAVIQEDDAEDDAEVEEVHEETAAEVEAEQRMYARLQAAYDSRGMMKVVFLTGTGDSVETDIGENIFNKMFRLCPVVEYVRNGRTHSVYVRTKALPEGGFNAHRIFTHTWSSSNNQLNQDFKIYDTITDAKADRGAWTYCNYDEPDIGYPRDCGKTGAVVNQWFSMPGGKFSPRGLTSGAGFNIWEIPDCPSPVGFKDESQAILKDLEENVAKPLNTIEDQAAEITNEETAAKKETAELDTVLNTMASEIQTATAAVKEEAANRHKKQLEDFKSIATKVGEVQAQLRQNRQDAETRYANEKAGVDQVSAAVDLTDTDAQAVRDEVLQNRKAAGESETALASERAQLDLAMQGVHDEILSKMLDIKGDVGALKVKVRANRRANNEHADHAAQEHLKLQAKLDSESTSLQNEVKAAQARLAPIQNADVKSLGTQAQAVSQEKQKVLATFASEVEKTREETGNSVNDLNLKLQAVNADLKQDQTNHRSVQAQAERAREAAEKTSETIKDEGIRIEVRLDNTAEHEHQNSMEATRSAGSVTGELQHLQHSFNADVDRINETAMDMAEAVKDHRIKTSAELDRDELVRKTDLVKAQYFTKELGERSTKIKSMIENKTAQQYGSLVDQGKNISIQHHDAASISTT